MILSHSEKQKLKKKEIGFITETNMNHLLKTD